MKTLTSVVVLVALTGTATALPLTCDEFKSRLSDAARTHGNAAEAPIAGWDKAYEGDEDHITRYEWKGSKGLSGGMRCGANDELIEFTIDADSIAAPARFQNLAAAATQAFTTGSYSQIFAFENGMFQIVAKQMKADTTNSTAQLTFDVDADVDASFSASGQAGGMGFMIGPAEFSNTGVDAARKRWTPKLEGQN